MEQAQHNGALEYGVGEVGVAGRSFRNRYAAVLFDEAQEPVAVGGVFETFGTHEIGVDVIRSHRQGPRLSGRRGGRARHRQARGSAALRLRHNIGSQRTALAAGFLPLLSEGMVT